MCRFLCRSLTLIALALITLTALSAPAMAQVCSSTNVITQLGSLSGKVPGPPSAQSTALLRYTFGNDVTSDCDGNPDNGGVTQTVNTVIVRPSCNISGGVCIADPGGDDGDPTTPAVEFLSLDATTCLGDLANITVDDSDPYAIALNFTVPLVFAPNTSCSVDVTLHVRERGNATTQNTVAQQYATDGVCDCDPELNAGGNASSQIGLTCPPCSTNFCAPELCNATTVQCDPQAPPDCENDDNDLCTPGFCDSEANGGNGACANGERRTCGNEDNFCAPGHCDGATGECVLDTPPTCPNTFCAPGRCDPTANACVLDTPPTCPNTFCAPGHCDPGADSCVLDTPPTCPNTFCAPGHCDEGDDACVLDTPPTCPNTFCAPGHCDPGVDSCVLDTPPTCPNSFCAPGHCDTGDDACVLDTPPDCEDDDNDACTPGFCDEAAGACGNGDRRLCDNETCQTCDALSGECVDRIDPPAECNPALGCRLTGGGIICDPDDPDSTCITDPASPAEIEKATFGGQVGAPYVIGGCNLDNFDCIQGQFTHMRHNRKGTFHASEYNSMICRCTDADGNDVLPVGQLCNPCQGPDCHAEDYPGPEPRPAPANVACFSGKGLWRATNGRREVPVAFRVEWEDRGEPGGGKNANLEDFYRIRIWIPQVPQNQQDEEATNLAVAACCSNSISDVVSEIGLPNVNDGGNLTHGNLQIHPQTGNPNNNSTCPLPE